MLGLDVAISLIPYSLYCVLKIGVLRPTDLIIQLANRLCTNLEGIVVDVVVRVGKLYYCRFLCDEDK